MSDKPLFIEKNPTLSAVEDFYRLRREGIGFIEKLASKSWTDYNIHDPGITILEALCYAITDLAYRIGWDVKDILTPEKPSSDTGQPYPDQAFFTARNILTVNPVTPDDFRRLLIDLKEVRNAWVYARECACDVHYYAWCDNNKQLCVSYQKPDEPRKSIAVSPVGLYEILLELENDHIYGDLNDRKIESKIMLEGGQSIVTELRFPDISLISSDEWKIFLESEDAFTDKNGASIKLTDIRLGATKTFDLYADFDTEIDRDNYVRDHWRNVFFIGFKIKILPSQKVINIENVALRLFGDVAAKNAITAKSIKDWFEVRGEVDVIQPYRRKALAKKSAVETAKNQLHAHRNLSEDYCNIKVVGVEEVAVCADIEVKPDADIEWVQARIWFEIEQYFNPPIPFHTLQELMDADAQVEEIFNGPELDSGFIKAANLEASSLKTELLTSDIISLLMKIEGVIAVNHLQLSKYDAEGIIVKGAADFDASKSSASWVLLVSERHQPRLYLNLSRFLFIKNGLPFQPRMDEANDTLTQLRGEAERPKNDLADKDIVIPKGKFRNPEEYFPLQHSFPLTYGIGPSGLPPHVPDLRKSQAKQLKAYLMVFEQLLGNALAQIANVEKLFSLDPKVDRTYFVKKLSEELINGFDEISNGLDQNTVEQITETMAEFNVRRNLFLDHLMARFGEQFSEYALILGNLDGKLVSLDKLIADKISFLKIYPKISHDRAKAFNYKLIHCSQENIPGIKKRVSLLLGYPDLKFVWHKNNHAVGGFKLTDCYDENIIWLEGDIRPDISSVDEDLANEDFAYRMLIKRMTVPEAYHVKKYNKYHLHFKDEDGDLLGDHIFDSKAEAQTRMDELLAWSANERFIVVEHLLLRPKFPGDALYPVCSDGDCAICTDGECVSCGDEDPYSSRLTFVMPGWAGLYADNLDMRRFAERTIRQEIPSHLIGKICWVGNSGSNVNPCEEVIVHLSELLISEGLISGDTDQVEHNACICSESIYEAFFFSFTVWYESKSLDYIHADTVDKLDELIKEQFSTAPKPSENDCEVEFDTSVWEKIILMMANHFLNIALHGWQFERFESAWYLWFEANAKIDWTEERLHERIYAILLNNLNDSANDIDVCLCAANILEQYGLAFYEWMKPLAHGDWLSVPGELPAFNNLGLPLLCDKLSFKETTDYGAINEAINKLLEDRYSAYIEVSYRLHVVVYLLSELRNTYPGATLHDCDDGSDHNPVRLGSTALGNHRLNTSTS